MIIVHKLFEILRQIYVLINNTINFLYEVLQNTFSTGYQFGSKSIFQFFNIPFIKIRCITFINIYFFFFNACNTLYGILKNPLHFFAT